MATFVCFGDCENCVAIKLLGLGITRECKRKPPKNIPDSGFRFSMPPTELAKANEEIITSRGNQEIHS